MNAKLKILLTGASGQVAQDLIAIASVDSSIQLTPLTHSELDITNYAQIKKICSDIKPDVVINTAAFTKVDLAEKEVELAFLVNREGPKLLAQMTGELGIHLIHLSTDYVFDGQAHLPYLETDQTSPLNIYGLSKLGGEQAVQTHCEKFIILRVAGVFGVYGINFLKTMLRLMREKAILKVVNDQITCPTPSHAIAKTLLSLAKNPINGLFHYCGDEKTSWYSFANYISETAKNFFPLRVQTIEPISTLEYPTAALRPLYSVLNCSEIFKTFGITQPSWKEGCVNAIQQLSIL